MWIAGPGVEDLTENEQKKKMISQFLPLIQKIKWLFCRESVMK